MERVEERPCAARAGGGGSSDEWRLLVGDMGQEAADGVRNMSVDAALLEAVAAGAPPALRLYRWDPPTLSFGRNQPAAGLYDEAEAGARGIAFVRRPTGGQAVLHDDELTYAVVAPVSQVGKPRAAYARINAALVAGLRSLGLEASLAGPAPVVAERGGVARSGAGHDWASACFRTPAQGEVVAGGRKLVGSAQRTEARTILQHGSILVGGSQSVAEALLVDDPPRVHGAGKMRPGWTTISAELGRPPAWSVLAAAVVEGFREVLGTALAPGRLTDAEEERARRLEERFASRAWTWRL